MTRRANASGETARLHTSSDVRYEAAPVEEDAVLSKFARAAWYCEDAFGYKFDRTLDKKTKKQRDLYVKRENLRYPEHLVCVALLALVSFVEIPLWCLGNRAGLWTWQGHHEVCTAPGHIYLSNTCAAINQRIGRRWRSDDSAQVWHRLLARRGHIAR